MAYDIRSEVITDIGSASISVPRLQWSCTLNDSQTGALLHDFTGANVVNFPNVLNQLNAAQRLELLHLIKSYLIRVLLGL
jgi:hypothetical protein